MLVSITWLEELLNKSIDVAELQRVALHYSGLEIEEQKTCGPEGIVIGEIKELGPHPTMKNLTILRVKTNTILEIVTAAKNIKQGDRVLVGTVGAELAGTTITSKMFDAVESQGVLVSEEELGLEEKSTGVIVVDKGSPGDLFKTCFDDIVLDLKTTTNRPDWLSMLGIARELSAQLDTTMAKPPGLYATKQPNRAGRFKIIIQDRQGCPRYTARIFDNVAVHDSPFWMKWRLHCMGMKPINNVVDITNLLLLLNGQPQHPFDMDRIHGRIIVRRARSGEQMVTLEGTTLTLHKDDLVIADTTGAVALGGIIGGQRAQISPSTTKVLLESAYFDPKRIAHTARRLGLMTEASMRFEREGDIAIVDQTSADAARLLSTYAGAQEREFVSVGRTGKPTTISFSPARLNQVLSLHLTPSHIKNILKKINVQTTGTSRLSAKIPHYRRDLKIEEDIYEEVARVFGYMNIPETPPRQWGGRVAVNKNLVHEERMKDFLIGQGFSETYNISFLASKRLIDLGFHDFVKIQNPLNERFDALRPTLFVGLLDCVNFNIAQGNRSLKLFEVGNILLSKAPFQEKRLAAICGGELYPDFWEQGHEQISYFDAKGVLESVLALFHVQNIEFKETRRTDFSQALTVLCAGKELGYLGCLDDTLCKEKFFYFELAVEQLFSLMSDTFYIPPGKFPASTRDLSFLAHEAVKVPEVIDVVTRVGGPILEKVVLFDYYRGKNLPPDRKNLGFRFYFRAPDRTLTDSEVEGFIKKIGREVTEKFDAQLRTKEADWTN